MVMRNNTNLITPVSNPQKGQLQSSPEVGRRGIKIEKYL